MGERIADSELEWHAKQAGVIGSLARALAAERAALRELRERLARLDALVAEGRGLVSFGVTENGDVGLFRADDDAGLAYGDTVEDALMCWPGAEGSNDGDK